MDCSALSWVYGAFGGIVFLFILVSNASGDTMISVR